MSVIVVGKIQCRNIISICSPVGIIKIFNYINNVLSIDNNRLLNELSEGAWTTSLGRLFQIFITLLQNMYLVMLLENLR